tara:strand:- start:846 stop:1028 length:183 start_codon:yes stop_codon:yes gene_type:complete
VKFKMDFTHEQQEVINDLQKEVNLLKIQPQYKKYVEMRQLHLIDSKMQIIDNLLNKGVLK